jgi:ribonuclease BN (tRNA processing enzyme)
MREPAIVYEDENVRVTAISVDHFQVPPSVPLPDLPRAVAYRVEAGGRSFVYSGDTGPSKGLQRLSSGADVLVVEIVDLDGIAARLEKANINVPPPVRDAVVAGMRVNHLTGENVARLASLASVKKVVLNHFVPAPE